MAKMTPEERCMAEVYSSDSWSSHQCMRRGVIFFVGEDGKTKLFCNQHNPRRALNQQWNDKLVTK